MIINVTADPTGTVSSYNAITNAIALALTLNFDPAGGTVIQLGPGVFLTDQTIILPTGIILAGCGHNATFIRLADGSNVDVIQSDGFASVPLTGHNYWYVDGVPPVPHSFGLRGLTVDGNGFVAEAGNTSGSGVRFFGKRYVVDDVQVVDCAEYGFWSECGDTTGQNALYNDMPEACIQALWIRNCGLDGFHWEGPHDSRIERVIASNCGQIPINFFKGANSGATCDVGFVHGYGSGKNSGGAYAADYPAVQIAATIRIGELVAESAAGNSLLVTSAGSNTQIGILRAFANGNFSGAASKVCVLIDATYVQIDNARIDDAVQAGGMLLVDGADYFQCPALSIFGSGDGIGLDVDSNHNYIKGIVSGFVNDPPTSGGTGLRTGQTTARNNNHLYLFLQGNFTGWTNVACGVNNRYDLDISVPYSTGVRFTGVGPDPVLGGPKDYSNDWNVVARFDNDSGYQFSKTTEVTGTTFNLTLTSAQTLTFTHNMLNNPGMTLVPRTCVATLSNFSNNASNETVKTPLRIGSVGATTVDFYLRLSAAGSGTCCVTYHMEL